MKYLLLIISLVLNSSCKENINHSKENEITKTLVWSDEFDYTGLPDVTKWSYEEGFIRNNEPQFYTVGRSRNVYVEDGVLTITAIKEEFNGAKYTSASINTKGKADFLRGRIEIRAKVPTGNGVWPAAWTLGTNIDQVYWPLCGEIDILEYWGHNPNYIHSNVHTDSYNHSKGTGRGGNIQVEEPWEDFHIYAVEWYEDRLDFFYDDKLFYSCKRKNEGVEEWPFDTPQYLLLNLALISDTDNIDENVFPAKYLIDYVRYYKFSK